MISKIKSLFFSDDAKQADESDSKNEPDQFLPKADPRSHLQDYLEYYNKLEDPGYAVLVTGSWGTGKTFQVKKCISDSDCYYVSLFGVQTIEQLHAEVFAAAYPTLSRAGKFIEQAGDTAKGAGGRCCQTISNSSQLGQ